jgi:hypothetical protein
MHIEDWFLNIRVWVENKQSYESYNWLTIVMFFVFIQMTSWFKAASSWEWFVAVVDDSEVVVEEFVSVGIYCKALNGNQLVQLRGLSTIC